MDKKLNYDIIASNIKRLIFAEGLSVKQIADELNINQGNTNSFLKRTKPTLSLDNLYAFSKRFGYSLDYFLVEHDEHEEQNKTVQIIYYDNIKASAGHGNINENVSSTFLEVKKDLIDFGYPLKYVYAIKVEGDSMQPTLFEGDILFVLNIRQYTSDFIFQSGIYIIDDDFVGVRVKRLDKDKYGNMLVKSDNPNYDTIIYTPEEYNNESIRVIGKVIACFSRFIK